MKKVMSVLVLSLLAVPVKADVVFSFDDGWNSTHEVAFPILRHNGIKGTAYISTAQVGHDDFMPWKDVKDLADFAWEIGNHTAHHKDISKLPYGEVKREVAFAQAAFAKHDLHPTTFASPYGETTPKIESLLAHEFIGARGAWNTGPSVVFSFQDKGVDLYNLPVYGVYSPVNLESVESLIALSVKEQKHLIFMFHRITDKPTNKYEITAEDLQGIVDLCIKYNVKTVTLSELIREQ